jgi:hypothetical protein
LARGYVDTPSDAEWRDLELTEFALYECVMPILAAPRAYSTVRRTPTA